MTNLSLPVLPFRISVLPSRPLPPPLHSVALITFFIRRCSRKLFFSSLHHDEAPRLHLPRTKGEGKVSRTYFVLSQTAKTWWSRHEGSSGCIAFPRLPLPCGPPFN